MIKRFRQLRGHQGFRKYFANTSWLFAEKILRMAIGLFVSVWVTRYLEPDRFGLFSYAQSFVALFTVIAMLGLNNIIVRHPVKNEVAQNELIGTAFWLKLVATFDSAHVAKRYISLYKEILHD